MVNFEVHFSTQISTFIYQSIISGSSQDLRETSLSRTPRSLKQSDLPPAAARGLAISFRKNRENLAYLRGQDLRCARGGSTDKRIQM